MPIKLDDGTNEAFLWINDSYVSPLTSHQIPKVADAFFWVGTQGTTQRSNGILPLDLSKHQGKIHSDTKFRVPFGNIVWENQDHFCNLSTLRCRSQKYVWHGAKLKNQYIH